MKAAPELSGQTGEPATLDLALPHADSLAVIGATLLQTSISRPETADIFQQIINGLSEQIALLDQNWNILVVNEAWTRTAALYGYFGLLPGTNYFEFLREKASEGHSSAGRVVQGIAAMEESGEDDFRFLYHGSDRWAGHSFQLCIHRMEIAGRTFAMVTRHDVTELLQLRQLREGYTHHLIEGQAEERRRMAREIHDSTMQLLTGLGLALGHLKRARRHREALDIVTEMEQLLGEAQGEIRAISYLAHPPMLKNMGLVEALRMLVEGYGRRTGLRVSLNIAPDVRIGWEAAEVATYRIVQEALSNIHRHAKATDVAVALYRRRSLFHTVIIDNGIGMPAQLTQGVGLASMRSRLAELGGRLTIRNAWPGTMLVASLPARTSRPAIGGIALQA